MGELRRVEEEKQQLPAQYAEPKQQLKLVTKDQEIVLTSVLVNGDLSKLNEVQKWTFYKGLCERLGLDPFTRPFKIIKAQGKEVLYADATLAEQLAALRDLTVEPVDEYIDSKGNLVIRVKVYSQSSQRFVVARGVLPYENLAGEAAANALMKCETKAFRRGVLKYCGLSEVQGAEDAPRDGVQVEVGEAKEAPVAKRPENPRARKQKQESQAQQEDPAPPAESQAEPETVNAEIEESAEAEESEVDTETGEVIEPQEVAESSEESGQAQQAQAQQAQEEEKTVTRKRGW